MSKVMELEIHEVYGIWRGGSCDEEYFIDEGKAIDEQDRRRASLPDASHHIRKIWVSLDEKSLTLLKASIADFEATLDEEGENNGAS